MQFNLVTLFPSMFDALRYEGVIAKAITKGLLSLNFFNPIDYVTDNTRVDDKSYGGGPGMLIKPLPLEKAITTAQKNAPPNTKVIYLAPEGELLNHPKITQLSQEKAYILISGRYEGIDQRVIDTYVDASYSIGDYVITGGELASMVFIDALSRFIPGVLGDSNSAAQDSFANGLLDYPHYTRPQFALNKKVPQVLVNGDHKCILRWRIKQSLGKTWLLRPDLLKHKRLDAEEQLLLDEYINQHSANKGKTC